MVLSRRGCGVGHGKTYTDEMSGDLLGSASEGVLAVVSEEANFRLIGATDFKMTAREMAWSQVREPFARVCGVKPLGFFQYVAEDVGNIRCCQAEPLPQCDTTEQIDPKSSTVDHFVQAGRAQPPVKASCHGRFAG
jgi:hypothetical protein